MTASEIARRFEDRAAGHALPFPDGSFDTILCVTAITYLSPERAIREWMRALRPPGRIVFTTPKTNGITTGRLFREVLAANGVLAPDPNESIGSPAALLAMTGAAGARVDRPDGCCTHRTVARGLRDPLRRPRRSVGASHTHRRAQSERARTVGGIRSITPPRCPPTDAATRSSVDPVRAAAPARAASAECRGWRRSARSRAPRTPPRRT